MLMTPLARGADATVLVGLMSMDGAPIDWCSFAVAATRTGLRCRGTDASQLPVDQRHELPVTWRVNQETSGAVSVSTRSMRARALGVESQAAGANCLPA